MHITSLIIYFHLSNYFIIYLIRDRNRYIFRTYMNIIYFLYTKRIIRYIVMNVNYAVCIPHDTSVS